MTENKIPADWQILLNQLQIQTAKAKRMGGTQKLEKRAAAGKLNARELVTLFTDTDSFEEIGTLVGSQSYHGEIPAPADALIGGIARINQQAVVIAVEDFTVQGGSIGHGTNAKRVRLATLALQHNIPFVMLLDGAGARMSNGLNRHPYGPNDLQIIAQLSGKVPTVAIVIGSSAGHSAVGGLLMDFIIMLKDASMFAAGPPLVAAALGEIVTKEELGGARIHTHESGVAHNLVASEEDAAKLLQQYLGYFLQHKENKSIINKELDNILNLVTANLQTPYNILPVITELLDNKSWLEIQPDFGKAIVTGLGRLNGKSIAIIANQPNVLAGSIDHQAANKAADFITTIGKSGLPVLFLADTPGVMSGSAAERAGTLRAAARMYRAQSTLQSPKLHITLRKAFGFGSCLMAMNPFDKQTASFALPGISLGGIPAAGGSEAAGLDKELADQIQESQNNGALTAGDALAYDEIIDPRDLRKRLISSLALLEKIL